MSKRSTDEGEDEEMVVEDVEEKCRVDMWRCLSKVESHLSPFFKPKFASFQVIEGGLHYIDKPEGLMG